MNRRNVLKLSTAGLASIALPGFGSPLEKRDQDFSVEAIFESSTDAGQAFASTLRAVGIVTHAIERDVSGIWYEHLNTSLKNPGVVLGLTYEPEAYYLGTFARELRHHQVIRLDLNVDVDGIMVEPINLKSGKAFLDPLPCKAGRDWPEKIAQKFAASFGYTSADMDSKYTNRPCGIENRMIAWAIAPIQPRQENQS